MIQMKQFDIQKKNIYPETYRSTSRTNLGEISVDFNMMLAIKQEDECKQQIISHLQTPSSRS